MDETAKARAGPAIDPGVARKVDDEMTRLLYRSANFGLFSNFVLAGILVLVAGRYFPTSLNAWWLSTILGISVLRLGLNLAFKRRAPASVELPKWRTAFLTGLVLSGLTWGLAGWFYLRTPEVMPRIVLIFIIVGMNAGAARSLAPVLVSYWLYVTCTFAPILVRMATMHDAGSWSLVLLTIVYVAFLVQTTYQHNAAIRHLYQLIFENEQLVATLSEAKQRAEEVSRAKSNFLGTMSHEIRTPMNGIIGMLQMLQASPLNDEQRSYTEVAGDSAEILMRLINDILDFSKIESGKLEFDSAPFSIAAAVEEVVNSLRPDAEAKNLAVAVTISASLPPTVIGDSARFKQVLFNLVGNAIKFTDAGSVGVSARLVRFDTVEATIRFSVVDTGIGIEPAKQERLFQAFVQADSSMSRRFGGAGLGLAISQRLVERMRGMILVQSEIGRGSEFTFEITLPVGPVPRPAPPVNSLPGFKPLSGRVLIVEDDRVNQHVIRLMLERFGLQCTVADHGEAAVDFATRESWDLVLMDCQMPGMNGYDATRAIRTQLNGRRLPIIAITANATAEDRAACAAAGMDDFLAKPVRREELRARLERWLRPVPA